MVLLAYFIILIVGGLFLEGLPYLHDAMAFTQKQGQLVNQINKEFLNYPSDPRTVAVFCNFVIRYIGEKLNYHFIYVSRRDSLIIRNSFSNSYSKLIADIFIEVLGV